MALKFCNPRRLYKLIYGAIGMTHGMLLYPIAWIWIKHPTDPIALAVKEILMLGFYGTKASSPSAQLIGKQIRRGQINGVFFVSSNVGTKNQLQSLLNLFGVNKQCPLIAIDHEGGTIQRLTQEHGTTVLPSARQISEGDQTISVITALYKKAGLELKSLGFNVNLGPVLDFDNPHNRAIGFYDRSFSSNPKIIYQYAKAFIEGFSAARIVCALKHFPGHGNSIGDSHYQPADISSSWTPAEILPYQQLIDIDKAPMIMSGHLRLNYYEPSGKPATFSRAIITNLLREEMRFNGVVVTDDLDMEAISRIYSRREAIIEAINAGNDLLMIKNVIRYDPLLPKKALFWIRQAIKTGQLQESQILAAAERVRKMKQKIL